MATLRFGCICATLDRLLGVTGCFPQGRHCCLPDRLLSAHFELVPQPSLLPALRHRSANEYDWHRCYPRQKHPFSSEWRASLDYIRLALVACRPSPVQCLMLRHALAAHTWLQTLSAARAISSKSRRSLPSGANITRTWRRSRTTCGRPDKRCSHRHRCGLSDRVSVINDVVLVAFIDRREQWIASPPSLIRTSLISTIIDTRFRSGSELIGIINITTVSGDQ